MANKTSADYEEQETDLTEIFTPEEIEEYLNKTSIDYESDENESNLDSERQGVDLDEVFTPEEQEEYYYGKPETVPFSQLSNSQKAIPLERVVRRYCISNKLKYDIQFRDLARNKNHKKTKGKHDVDFIINDLAAIEVKNWECFTQKRYVVTKRDIDSQVLKRFSTHSNLKKILIIANPWWERDALKYLFKQKVEVIELGFQVTFDTDSMELAFWKTKPELDRLLYIQYLSFQRLALTI